MGNIYSLCIKQQNDKIKKETEKKNKTTQEAVYKNRDHNLTEYYLKSKFLFHM